MTINAYSQQFYLSEKGLDHVNLGENISEINSYSFRAVKDNPDILKHYDFAFDDVFDYYYADSDSSLTLFTSKKKIEKIFLATNKSNDIIGIIIFTSSEQIELITRCLNFIFEHQKLQLETTHNDFKRQQRFWANQFATVFLSFTNSTATLKLSFLALQDSPSPFISMKSQ